MKLRSSTLGRSTLSTVPHFQYISNNILNFLAVCLSIIGQVGQNVGLPIWFASAPDPGIDAYFVLLYTCFLFCVIFGIGSLIQWCLGHFTFHDLRHIYLKKTVIFEYFLVGFFTALNGLFLVFAAPPQRCPEFLQSALTNTMIPLVIMARILILRKIPTCIQVLCALGVVIGLVATSIPSIFDLDPTAAQKSQATGIWKLLWPLIFAFSLVPAALYTVLEEKYLQRDLNPDSKTYKQTMHDSDNPIPMSVFLFLITGFQTISFVFMFWYDIIPTIGFATNLEELTSNFVTSFRFSWALDGAGPVCAIFTWVFVIMYCMTSYGQGLLLRYTEGAVYSSMVAALVTPIGEIFWMLFSDKDGEFKWEPSWTSTSWYPLAGLLIIVPCVYVYNTYGEKAFEKKLEEERVSEKKKMLIQKVVNVKHGNSPQSIYNPNQRNLSSLTEADMSLGSMYGSPQQPLATPKR